MIGDVYYAEIDGKQVRLVPKANMDGSYTDYFVMPPLDPLPARLGIKPGFTLTVHDLDPDRDGYAGRITLSWDWAEGPKSPGLHGASSTLFCTPETWEDRKAQLLEDLDSFLIETIEASRTQRSR